jgi:hypothetical protein
MRYYILSRKHRRGHAINDFELAATLVIFSQQLVIGLWMPTGRTFIGGSVPLINITAIAAMPHDLALFLEYFSAGNVPGQLPVPGFMELFDFGDLFE